ncbi:cytidine deaminase [Marinitenerispora sediminis]|uniref:Cytidine deaminase n=1 Tax=Marinitenerispora sediminis TaxID=1931232 RepID=A0A368T8T9_9ACTN|nr:cytidine deaminase [Marinitenerispora sediminis]RCV57703.1 cytidine deaminase [Marinitenerispora sediminis]RCV60779.1 cytidine deaminase [Marinitenerispora sediminis]
MRPDEDLGPEDGKLITLARSARARNAAAEGAAVRDETGRTYVATTVALPALELTALQAAVAAAVSSGARNLEAAVVVTEAAEHAPVDLAVARDLATAAVVLVAPDGTPARVTRA